MLAFDVAQFFPSLNHSVLVLVLKRFGFLSKLCSFFSHYLVNRETEYFINGETSKFYPCSIGVGQGLALSPILSALYISPLFHLMDKWITNKLRFGSPAISSFLSLVDDGLLITTDHDFTLAHESLKVAYGHMTTLLTELSLVMEHTKTELINFSLWKDYTYNPAISLGYDFPPLPPKSTWQYLGIFFDCALTFK